MSIFFYPLTCLPAIILATVMTNTIHKPNNFEMAALDSSRKLDGFCILGKAKKQVLVVTWKEVVISFPLKWAFIWLDRS